MYPSTSKQSNRLALYSIRSFWLALYRFCRAAQQSSVGVTAFSCVGVTAKIRRQSSNDEQPQRPSSAQHTRACSPRQRSRSQPAVSRWRGPRAGPGNVPRLAVPVESAVGMSKLGLTHVDTASYTPRKAYRHAVKTSHNVGGTGTCQQLSTIGRVARLLEPGSGSLGSINSGCEGISGGNCS